MRRKSQNTGIEARRIFLRCVLCALDEKRVLRLPPSDALITVKSCNRLSTTQRKLPLQLSVYPSTRVTHFMPRPVLNPFNDSAGN